MKKFILPAVALAISFSVSTVYAADQHAGDVQPWKSGGQVYTNGNLFEGDFGDLAGGLYKTDDPGYDADTAQGAFGANNWLWFNGLGSLKSWNGSAWSNSVPNGEYVTIDDALGNTSTFSAGGVANPLGVIGAFDGAGDLHEHLDFSIFNASNALGGSIGAYWIDLQLVETLANNSTPVSTASAPFSIIFNRGLAEVEFENAVSAVPLPAAVWMFGAGLMGMLHLNRRKSIAASV